MQCIRTYIRSGALLVGSTICSVPTTLQRSPRLPFFSLLPNIACTIFADTKPQQCGDGAHDEFRTMPTRRLLLDPSKEEMCFVAGRPTPFELELEKVVLLSFRYGFVFREHVETSRW